MTKTRNEMTGAGPSAASPRAPLRLSPGREPRAPQPGLRQPIRSYYHTILPFYERETAELPDLDFWRKLMKERRPKWVLELGAGTGRVTAALAELAPVVALDLSHEMLQHAARHLAWRRGQQKRHKRFPAHLVVADMRQFGFARHFDLIVAPNDPFAHLIRQRDRQRALQAIARQLAPAGRLVIDGLYLPERERTEVRRHHVGAITVAETWIPIGRGQQWRARYRYQSPGHHLTASFLARAWDAIEAAALFRSCGLEICERWGGYDRAPFTPSAEKIILVARLVARHQPKRHRNLDVVRPWSLLSPPSSPS